MPKGFTEAEQEKIRSRLIAHGRRLFETYGIRKTNVEELTRAAGISKGAFYRFYPSKEELFMDIMETLEVEIRENLMRTAFQAGGSKKDALRMFLKTALLAVSDYPLFKNLTGDDYNYLVRKLPEERLNAHLISDSQAVTKLLHEFGLVDSFRIQDPVLVANVFRSLFFITMHKAELGEGSYQLTINLLVDMVVDYLVED
jgi:AcrR family transcriptional regulator